MAEQNEKQNEEQYMEQDKKRKEKERIKRADEAFVRDHEERMAMLRYLIDIVGHGDAAIPLVYSDGPTIRDGREPIAKVSLYLMACWRHGYLSHV